MSHETETRRRLLSAFGLFAYILFALDRGGWWFTGFVLVIQSLGVIELGQLVGKKQWLSLLGAECVWLGTTSSFLWLYHPSLELIGWTIFLGPAYDTSAFLIGRLWGQHKLPATISVNKSWEGTIGGVIGGSGLAFLYYVCLGQLVGFRVEHPYLIAFGGPTCGMLGDLLMSWFKRRYGRKDSTKNRLILATGHGGFVDRFFSPACGAAWLLALTS